MDVPLLPQPLGTLHNRLDVVDRSHVAGVLDHKLLGQAGLLQRGVLRPGRGIHLLMIGPVGDDRYTLAVEPGFAQDQVPHVAAEDEYLFNRAVEASGEPVEDSRDREIRPQDTRHNGEVGIYVVNQQQAFGSSKPACQGDDVGQRRRIGHNQDHIPAAETQKQLQKDRATDGGYVDQPFGQYVLVPGGRPTAMDLDAVVLLAGRCFHAAERVARLSADHTDVRLRRQPLGDLGDNVTGRRRLGIVEFGGDPDRCAF